jgi:HD superfamily phosphodiesterase
MVGTSIIIEKASAHASELLQRLPIHYTYHNLDHTRRVVEACRTIGEASNITAAEMEVVTLAAWFHDTGFIEAYEGHEERSVDIATRFLGDNGYPRELIDQVASCIRSTRSSHQPANRLEEIIRDADLSHLGKKSYFERSELLRAELENIQQKRYSDLEWTRMNIEFLGRHQFQTLFAQAKYTKQRLENLSKLEKQLQKKLAQENGAIVADASRQRVQTNGATAEVERKGPLAGPERLTTEKKPERGIETMFRVTSHNHMSLSSMADGKAHIMISINALVISLVVSLLIRKLDDHPELMIPAFLLLGVCLVTIIFATLSTRPKVTTGTFSAEDIEQKRVNLLFFGNFHNVALEDYERGMKEMMKDRDYLYGSMIKDIYYLGKVIARKYWYLRMSYNVFMYGLVLSVIAFAVAFLVAL